jgi:hypothetical protein
MLYVSLDRYRIKPSNRSRGDYEEDTYITAPMMESRPLPASSCGEHLTSNAYSNGKNFHHRGFNRREFLPCSYTYMYSAEWIL